MLVLLSSWLTFLAFLVQTHGYLVQPSPPSSSSSSGTRAITTSTTTLHTGGAESDGAFVGDSTMNIHPSAVLVIGATGRVGKEVVKKLASSSSPSCKVKCLVRDLTSKDATNLASLPNTELYQGCVEDINSLIEASKGCQVVVDVHGMKPPRFTKLPYDLFVHPSKDRTHPYNVNYLGTKRVLAAMKINNVQKLVRITGSLTGKSAWLLITMMFNLLLSMSPKWHERSEIDIRESGIDYTVIRPTGIAAEPSAIETKRSLIMLQGDTDQRPPKNANKISLHDLSELVFRSAQNLRYLSKTSVVVSSRIGTDGMQGWNEEVVRTMSPDYVKMKPHRHSLVATLVGGFVLPSIIAGLVFAVRYVVFALKKIMLTAKV